MAKVETEEKVVAYEYGAVGSKFRLLAANKLTAYATMVVHYHKIAGLLVVYSPVESKDDMLCLAPINYVEVGERMDEMFGGEGSFFQYIESQQAEINKCLDTVERIF